MKTQLRYHCPVLTCRWSVIGDAPSVLDELTSDQTTRDLEAHLTHHTPAEFAQTIASLRDQIVRLGGDPTEGRHASTGRHLAAGGG